MNDSDAEANRVTSPGAGIRREAQKPQRLAVSRVTCPIEEILIRAEARCLALAQRYAKLFVDSPFPIPEEEEAPFWQWVERQLRREGVLPEGMTLFVTKCILLALPLIDNLLPRLKLWH